MSKRAKRNQGRPWTRRMQRPKHEFTLAAEQSERKRGSAARPPQYVCMGQSRSPPVGEWVTLQKMGASVENCWLWARARLEL